MNWKGQGNIAIGIISIIVIGIIFIGGFGLWRSFYDFEALEGAENTSGTLDIDESTLDDIDTSLEELNEVVFENYDFEALLNAIIPPIIIIGSIGVIILVVLFITR